LQILQKHDRCNEQSSYKSKCKQQLDKLRDLWKFDTAISIDGNS
jgi:hypothetical protein